MEAVEARSVDHPDARFCTVCETASERFQKGGTGKGRENARCPQCGSLERHRLLWLHLAERVWPSLTDRKIDILHIAPEPFFVERLKFRPDVNYISGDIEMSQSMAKMDLTDIQFWDAQFDLVICSHVLEHIPDDQRAMREMHRILRDAGTLIVMVPLAGERTDEDFSITTPQERLERFGQADHVRIYGRDIKDRLDASGFETVFWPSPEHVRPALLRFIAAPGRTVIECRKT